MSAPADPAIAVMENPAQTVRDLMATHGTSEMVAHPSMTKGATTFTTPHLISLPAERRVEDLTDRHRIAAEYLKPARRKGTARLADLESLVTWANRFKGDTSALFANPDMAKPSLTCIADYHAQGAIDVSLASGDPTARHCHHRAIYDFPLSKEWKAWMAVSDQALDKDQMGEFIEANVKDIMDPTPAILAAVPSDENTSWENRLIETAHQIQGRFGQSRQLLEMSRKFVVLEQSDLTVKSNRDTGEAEVHFVNEHKDAAGKPLNIPNLIIITIPVFLNGAPYRMAVRFRYRKSGQTVKFILSVYTPEKIFEAAFNEAVSLAADQTALPVFRGFPEA